MALLAEGGLEGLGIRALARRLHSSTSTLYRQLPGGMDELRTLLAEQIMREVVEAIGEADVTRDDADWALVLERSAVIALDVLGRHPNAAALFVGQVSLGPMGLVRYRRSLRIMEDAGLSPSDAIAADHALARLIVGYALQIPVDAATEDPSDLRNEFDFAVRTFIRGLRAMVTN